MAVNSIQGSLVLHEFSEDNGTTWKTLVCAQGGKFESTTNVTIEKTKCGPIKGVDDPDWKMSGDAVANMYPTEDQVSYSDMLRWQQAKELIQVRLQSPADDTLSLAEGEAFYHGGEAYVTNVTIDNSNGAVVKFTWGVEGQGVLETTKPISLAATLAPASITQAAGGTITLTATIVGGTPPFLGVFHKGGSPIVGASETSNSRTRVYTKTPSVTGDTGSYKFVVSEDYVGADEENVNSNTVAVTVT